MITDGRGLSDTRSKHFTPTSQDSGVSTDRFLGPFLPSALSSPPVSLSLGPLTAPIQPIDMEILAYILELGEDGESCDFAWEIISAYFEHAETTFKEMGAAM